MVGRQGTDFTHAQRERRPSNDWRLGAAETRRLIVGTDGVIVGARGVVVETLGVVVETLGVIVERSESSRSAPSHRGVLRVIVEAVRVGR